MDELRKRRATESERAVGIRADVAMEDERRSYDVAHHHSMTDALLGEYGSYIAGLAPWSWFVTLTHRMPDGVETVDAPIEWSHDGSVMHRAPREVMTGATIVGPKPHRRAVREWFYEDVRRLDPRAQWWSETELHKSGSAHEHGLLAVRDVAPYLKMRQAWYERAGFALFRPMENVEGAARYVAKYTGKAAALAPSVFGVSLRSVDVLPGSWASREGLNTVAEYRRVYERLR